MTVLTTDRVLVDGKTVLQCWFPRTVELFDEERHRLETWRTGVAYHRSTDRGRENCLRDADNRRKTNDLCTGIRDWKHLSERIKEHNFSSGHMEARAVYELWKKIDSTIDKELENEIRKEASFWKMVLERLIDVMLIPEKNYLALRGQRENLNEEVYHGNFLSVVELVAQYDHILRQVLNMPKGYNGVNIMSGVYNGVQKQIKDIQPNAENVFCATHNLNLVVDPKGSTGDSTGVYVERNKKWGSTIVNGGV
ncbi:hypothetical protein EVAR_56689_1 [Eumeta japonica]|uniref:Uncharacterized protein n=1 Tax=Eumeta variegata TaxID=151549 RepID=A0A4C2A0T7_EUMVA|nr:hypothetical protein EVAR_56689_1 [Eumeta japonica]